MDDDKRRSDRSVVRKVWIVKVWVVIVVRWALSKKPCGRGNNRMERPAIIFLERPIGIHQIRVSFRAYVIRRGQQ